ncbi:hypothetical protein GF327_09535, partial [Candidatus Woesearchaeota archaeon]|nr:hypothetical protein [Candidatus Woesearchaeota archaeon]
MERQYQLFLIIDDFIEGKKGKWNHEDWLSLIEKIQSKGIKVNEKKLGEMIEKKKEQYFNQIKKNGISDISLKKQCKKFIEKKKGSWDHDEWEEFKRMLKKNGFIGSFDKVGAMLEKQKMTKNNKSEKEKIVDNLCKNLKNEKQQFSKHKQILTEKSNRLKKKEKELDKKERELDKIKSEIN